MCGACAPIGGSWPERIAPLRPGTAARRARVVTTLLRSLDSQPGRRVTVTPWPGGGLRWMTRGGLQFARSLSEAMRTLTRQYGQLVPLPNATSLSGRRRELPFPVTPEAAAVWCVAAVEAGWATRHSCVLNLGDREIVLHGDHARLRDLPCASPSLRTSYDSSELLAHWASTLREFRIEQRTLPDSSENLDSNT